MIDQNGVEAFVKAGDIGGVVSALSMTIGALVADGSSDPSLRIYRFQDTSAVLTESEDGFLSVWVLGANGWLTSAALGRYLATALNCIIRCDPGPEFPEVSPHSSIFLQIENGRESLVTWGERTG
jgi:hypothetical protein